MQISKFGIICYTNLKIVYNFLKISIFSQNINFCQNLNFLKILAYSGYAIFTTQFQLMNALMELTHAIQMLNVLTQKLDLHVNALTDGGATGRNVGRH